MEELVNKYKAKLGVLLLELEEQVEIEMGINYS